jgi:hypothetical protein
MHHIGAVCSPVQLGGWFWAEGSNSTGTGSNSRCVSVLLLCVMYAAGALTASLVFLTPHPTRPAQISSKTTTNYMILMLDFDVLVHCRCFNCQFGVSTNSGVYPRQTL